MSSIIEQQLQEVDQLIVHGKLQEANEMINESLKNKKISKIEELRFLVLKSELEFYFGNFDESIRLADIVLKKNEGLDNLLLTADALTWKATSSFWNGTTKNLVLEVFAKGLTTVSATKNLPVKTVAKRKAQLLAWQAFAILHLGEFERSLELANEAFSFAEKSGYKNVITHSLLVLGDIYQKHKKYPMSNEYLNKALAIANELGNKFLIAYSYLLLTGPNNWLKESKKVEELFQKGISLAEEIGSKLLLAYKNNMGNFYRITFQFDKALENLHEALKYAPFLKYMANALIGIAYFWKNDLKQAQNYFLKSIKFSEEMNDKYIYPASLYNLILISLELNNLDQAKEYLNRLKELKEETDYYIVDQYYRFTSILVMKASGIISDLAKAEKLLEIMLDEESLMMVGRLDFLFSLLEIRLKELQLSANEENLKEVQKRLHHLEVEAEEQQHHWLLANVYRLQSQLALVELDIKKAFDLLDKTQTIADEINVELLKKEITIDREKIDQQLMMVQEFQKQKAPISETVKLVSLENTAKSIKQETVIEERDQETGEIIEYRKLFVLKI